MRANLSWMSWNSEIGRSQSMRSLAYCTESFRHSSMSPRDMAATPARSVTKLPLALSLPSRPSGSSFGLAEEPVLAHPDVGQEDLAGRARSAGPFCETVWTARARASPSRE